MIRRYGDQSICKHPRIDAVLPEIGERDPFYAGLIFIWDDACLRIVRREERALEHHLDLMERGIFWKFVMLADVIAYKAKSANLNIGADLFEAFAAESVVKRFAVVLTAAR